VATYPAVAVIGSSCLVFLACAYFTRAPWMRVLAALVSGVAVAALNIAADIAAQGLGWWRDNTQRAVASLFSGWAPVIQASSGYYARQTATPFSQVLEISRGMRRDARDWIGPGAPDQRLNRIRELLEDVASAPAAARDLPRRQDAVLQTCYLATHAVAGALSRYGAGLRQDDSTRPRGLLVAALGSRVESAEQILDAQLSVRSAVTGPAVGPAQSLGAAIADWTGLCMTHW
jgi:hypothetical protein